MAVTFEMVAVQNGRIKHVDQLFQTLLALELGLAPKVLSIVEEDVEGIEQLSMNYARGRNFSAASAFLNTTANACSGCIFNVNENASRTTRECDVIERSGGTPQY